MTDVERPQFNRFQALWSSFYSADLYRDVARRWKGVGALYLLLLLAITWLPSAYRWTGIMQDFAAKAVAGIVQMPTITIENGVMRATPPGRHVLEPFGPGDLRIIVDDTIDAVPPDFEAEAIVVARREVVMIRPERRERRTWALTPTTNYELTREKAGSYLAALDSWVPVVGYIASVAGALVFRILQALAYGAIGMIFVRKWRSGLDYQAVVRLAAVAVTPVIVLRTLIWFAPSEPAWHVRWPVAFVITLMYLRFAIRAALPDGRELQP
jgi:hypothetical protein